MTTNNYNEGDTVVTATVDTAVLKTAYDANTVLAADSDNTPASLSVAASSVVGRKATGNIDDLGGHDLREIEALADGLLTTGEETIPRLCLSSSVGIAPGGGTMRFAYFTARKTETVNSVRMITGDTAAGATPTLCRIGIYSVDGSGNLTLAASTANDTTLFAAINTTYTKALSAPLAKVAGTRYAVAALVVSGATIPTFVGNNAAAGQIAEAGLAPNLTSAIAGQADLPASIAVGSLVGSNRMPYVVLLP